MNTLDEKIDKALDELMDTFNALEIAGFMTKPRLALKTGMAIGFKMGLDYTQEEYEKKFKEYEEKINAFIKRVERVGN